MKKTTLAFLFACMLSILCICVLLYSAASAGAYVFLTVTGTSVNIRAEDNTGGKVLIMTNAAVSTKAVDYEPVHQITDYQPYTDIIHANNILDINETCLIEIWPEPIQFDDEESEEAEDYFTAMDDFAWYIAETRTRFEEMGIKSVIAEKQYLSFTLANNEKIIVDTRKEQNGVSVSTLLYKKGHIPIIISIVGQDMDSINNYLQR